MIAGRTLPKSPWGTWGAKFDVRLIVNTNYIRNEICSVSRWSMRKLLRRDSTPYAPYSLMSHDHREPQKNVTYVQQRMFVTTDNNTAVSV